MLLACLYELLGSSFARLSPINDGYISWFLQSGLRVDDVAIGPVSDPRRLESLFFGAHRSALKRLLTDRESSTNPSDDTRHERLHHIRMRCSSLATLVRNISFIDDNRYLANDRRLLDILQRILNVHHADMQLDQQYNDTCPNCCAVLDDEEMPSSPTRLLIQVWHSRRNRLTTFNHGHLCLE